MRALAATAALVPPRTAVGHLPHPRDPARVSVSGMRCDAWASRVSLVHVRVRSARCCHGREVWGADSGSSRAESSEASRNPVLFKKRSLEKLFFLSLNNFCFLKKKRRKEKNPRPL